MSDSVELVEMTASAVPLADNRVAITIDGNRMVLAQQDAIRLADLILWAAGTWFHRARDSRKWEG